MEASWIVAVSTMVVIFLCVLLLILCINLLTFYRLQSSPQQDIHSLEYPTLSILVPARNEEQCIEACVRSLVAQSYKPLEVLVLDDNSSDATATLVQRMIDELPPVQKGRLRLLHGEALPPGWRGKNFACHQLAQNARGDYLLFTDADTIHAPGTARAVIECMRTFGVKLLTAQPEHVVESIGERLVVPLLNFTILTLLPVALIPRRPEPSLATGNGQLLCFHRSAYEALGGHEAVKGRVLEDVLLARAVKAAGYRMIFVDALELIHCRMYRSFADVWAGFSKNLFAFYNYSLPFALIALSLNLLLFVMPPVLLLASLVIPFQPAVLFCAASAYLLAVLMRILLTLRFTRSQRGLMLALCLLHPISVVLECLILLNSIRWHYRKKGTVWKGRQYK
jgi:chlorobactene glucosyltransferase